MPLYFFSVQNGKQVGICNDGAEFPNREAAWNELTRVCADMIGGVSRRLGENTEWRMELLDDAKKPVFRIRLVGETLG